MWNVSANVWSFLVCGVILFFAGFFFPDKVPGTTDYLVRESQNLGFCKPKSYFKNLCFHPAVDWISALETC